MSQDWRSWEHLVDPTLSSLLRRWTLGREGPSAGKDKRPTWRWESGGFRPLRTNMKVRRQRRTISITYLGDGFSPAAHTQPHFQPRAGAQWGHFQTTEDLFSVLPLQFFSGRFWRMCSRRNRRTTERRRLGSQEMQAAPGERRVGVPRGKLCCPARERLSRLRRGRGLRRDVFKNKW